MVYTPHAELIHYESLSRARGGLLEHPAGNNYMRNRWAKWLKDDPCYNPNLARDRENLELRFRPERHRPEPR